MSEDEYREYIEKRMRDEIASKLNSEKYRLAILISKSCPYCRMIKEALKDYIDDTKMALIDVDSEDGKRVCDKVEINSVPQIIAIKGDMEDIVLCDMKDEGEDLVVKCGELTF